VSEITIIKGFRAERKTSDVCFKTIVSGLKNLRSITERQTAQEFAPGLFRWNPKSPLPLDGPMELGKDCYTRFSKFHPVE
jgi:hypothetical protein